MALAEIGSYYISLVPTANNISGHIKKTLAPAGPAADEAGAESGGRFSGAFGRATSSVGHALGTALKVGVATAMAGVAAAGAVGIKTAAELETAQIAFSTMLGSGEKARSFLGELKTFAAKTPFDLPGLQRAAQSLISIGIDSKKVLPIMTTLGNVTSGMGTGSEGIKRATVALQQMNAAGKISAEDLNQLRDAGIPVYELLTAATGKTTAQISEMRDKGELGREELELLMSALETGKGFERFNGLMEAQSESLTGLWETLKDTFSVGMAEAVEPALPILKAGLGGAIVFLSDTVVPKAQYALSELVGGITAFGAAWRYNDGDITSSGFPGFMERVAYWLHQTWDWLGRLDFSSVQGFFNSMNFGALAPAFTSIADSTKTLAPAFQQFMLAVGALTPDLARIGIELLAGALGFLADHVDTIIKFMPLIVAGFVAWRVAQMGVNAITAVSVPLMVAANLARTAAAVAEWRLVTAQRAAIVSGAAVNTQQSLGLIATVRGTVATVAHNTAVFASAVATRVAAGAQWLWNAAMSANPIAIVIKVLAALVAGLVWFFTQTDLGRQIWGNAMSAIGAAASWLWNSVISPVFGWIGGLLGGFFGWVASVAGPIWGSVMGGIGAAASWLWNSVIVPAFTGIMGAIGGVWNWLQTYVWPVAQSIFGWIGATVMNFWNGVIAPAFHNIGVIVNGFWLFARGVFQLLVAILREWVFPAITALWKDIIQPAFQAIGSFIGWVWNGLIVPVFQAIVGFIFNSFGAAFNWFWHGLIEPIWLGISAAIGWYWNGVIMPIFNLITGFLFGTLGPVWNWLGDKVKVAWDFLSGAISGTWNWLKSTIFEPLMSFIQHNVVDAFSKGVEGIKVAWEKVQEVAKAPVRFVIERVINDGIIGTFNNIADMLPGVDKLDKVGLPAGFARGGVLPGYQSAKKDDVLYPMRSGEGVLVPEVVRGLGPSTIHAWNAAGNNGGVTAVKALVANQGYARGGLIRPADGPITSGYRGPGRPDHDGVDIGAPMGAPVRAAGDGTVVDAGWHNWGGGNHVDLQHAGNLRTEYYHLSRVIAAVGQRVKKGDVIGNVGSTGNSTGPHLHYEVHIGDALHAADGVNPMSWLDGGGEFDPSGSMEGGGGGWNPFESVISGIKGLIEGAFPGGGKMVDVAVGTGMKIGTAVVDWIGSKFSGVFDSVSSVVGGVADSVQVTAWATEALVKTGHFDPWNLASLVRRIQQESGGDPRAVNNWDSNAAAGIPSKGIMQTIGPTFAQYRDPSLPNDIFDPVANIVAAINYTKSRYGNLRSAWDQPGGYALGGIIPTLFDGGGLLHNTGGPQIVDHRRKAADKVLTDAQWDAMYGIAEGSGRQSDIYVQNPFTAEYLIAETEQYAVDATGQAMQGSLIRARRGGKYSTKAGRV